MKHMGEREPGAADAIAAPGGGDADHTISEIIAEFSEVFAFARTRWAWYAEEVHPDLKGVGMMVLQTILRKGPITATALTQMLDMDKAVVSRQVSKLRQLGLIDAEPSAEDRRVTRLSVSPEATHTLNDIRGRIAHAYQEQFTGWSDSDLEQLRSALHRFNGTAHEGERPAWPMHRCGTAGGRRSDGQTESGDSAADRDAAPEA